jgi:acyl carrier protein
LSAYEFLSEQLVEKFDVDAEKISPESNLSDLGLDSLSIVELVFDVEDEYDVEISEEDANFASLGQAAELVEKLVKAKEG